MFHIDLKDSIDQSGMSRLLDCLDKRWLTYGGFNNAELWIDSSFDYQPFMWSYRMKVKYGDYELKRSFVVTEEEYSSNPSIVFTRLYVLILQADNWFAMLKRVNSTKKSKTFSIKEGESPYALP